MTRSLRMGRRSALRAAGVALGLPALEAMLPGSRRAHAAAAAEPRRLVLFIVGNGGTEAEIPGSFSPVVTGADWAPTTLLTPLTDLGLKGDLRVFTGLQNHAGQSTEAPGQSNHELSTVALLNARPVPNTQCQFGDLKGLTSMDQLAAYGDGAGITGTKAFTPNLPSLELSTRQDFGWCTTYLSWRDGKPLARLSNTQAAFDAIFSNGDATESKQAADRRRARAKSVLDAVLDQSTALKRKLGSGDVQRVDQFMASVRDLEDRVSASGQACAVPPRPPLVPGTGKRAANGATLVQRTKDMLDIIKVALQCDRTRVVTLMLEDSTTEITWPGAGSGNFHMDVVHGPKGPNRNAAMIAGFKWLMGQYAYLVSALKQTPDAVGGKSLLDTSAVVHLSELGRGDGHWVSNLPVVVAGRLGGAIVPGRHDRFGDSTKLSNPGRPVGDLYLSLLRGMGVNVSKVGASTEPLALT